MEPLKIVTFPDEVLRRECSLVREVTKTEIDMFDSMLYTMRYFKGIGLAAPQIGLSQRLIVVEVDHNPVCLANPEILDEKGKEKAVEGCLSVTDFLAEVERSYEVVVRGLNEKGKKVEIKARGLWARVFQHEIDHLSGRLIIDHGKSLDQQGRKNGNKDHL